jgi:preprotein translocase subunit SecF
MLNVIGKRKIYLTVSAILVLAAIVCIGVLKFEEGIDFRGGTLWEFKIQNSNISDVQSFFTNQLGIADARINQGNTSDDYLARIAPENEDVHKAMLQKLTTKYPSFQELSFSSIGPSVGAQLRKNSLIAIALVLIGISLYIAFAFRKVYRPISSWKYGWVTLATLVHDVAIPAGLLAILGHFKGIEIDSNFIVALLVVMGFSVHDTIVVFDRIRENLLLNRSKSSFGEVINESVNQTLARSINTSLTLILVLLAMYFVGPVNLKYFVLTLLVGVVTGIYSSIFVASPLLLVWHNWSNRGASQKS